MYKPMIMVQRIEQGQYALIDLKRITVGWYIIVIFAINVQALGLQITTPRIEGFHPLDEEPYAASPLNTSHPVILSMNTNVFKDTSVIDFEKRQITFRRNDALGYTMWEYHFSELSDYLDSRRNYTLHRGWYRDVLTAERMTDKQKKQQTLKMEWELPVQYPTWAQRVLGNEPPRLNIDGHITIHMGFDRSTFKEAGDNDGSKNSSNDFGFKINYQFGINGSVGKLIKVSIKVVDDEFVSENNFKNFKIEYKESTPGEMEDEIIQEVIAGWTNFDMPGTQLSGYAGSKDGLFGIKIKSKLGPLTLTTIASQEKGETQRQSAGTKSGGNSIPIRVDEFVKNKYFFIDTLYRNIYNKNNSVQNRLEIPAPRIDSLRVFLKKGEVQTANVSEGLISASVDTVPQRYYFLELKEGNHYYANKDEGYIRFDTTIRDYDHVALYVRSNSNTSLNRGAFNSADSTYNSLWTIKPPFPINNASDDPARFYLMWRNVYSLDTNAISSFELKVTKQLDNEASTERVRESNALISAVLGLTNEDGKPFIDRTYIYNKEGGSIIIPPYDTCSTCNEPFANPALGSDKDSIIYRYSSPSVIPDYTPFYSIVTTGKKRQTVVQLGWQLMPGTELVKTYGGEVLEKDRDYIIDYESGTLELISPRALAADGVDVTYQQESIFVPESKAFLGVRGEVALPFISEKSFIGTSLLWQNASTNDIPRLGQEPYSKFLLDFNIKIDIEPEWMTSIVNKIPLIQTETPSSAVFEFEAAHSRTNPNTNDVAYIDDFEDSRKSYPLGMHHSSWYKASPPEMILSGNSTIFGVSDTLSIYDSLFQFPPAWDYYWFQPRTDDKAFRDSVWVRTNKKATIDDDRFDPILRLHCIPSPDSSELSLRYKKSWAGIMHTISENSFSRNDYEYFEFALNRTTSKGKKLIIQMGVLNEDVSLDGGFPNGIGNREDTTLSGTANTKMDLGLDRKADKDEYYLVPSSQSGVWDTLKYEDPRLGSFALDPSKDNSRGQNGKEYEDDINNRRNASRLQGDGKFSSEDIGYDGTVQTSIKESYFEFVIDLDDTSYIDKTARVHYGNGWRKYRIPILDSISIKNSINNPNWNRVSMVRLIWTEFDSTDLNREQQLLLADMQFTGSYWQSQSDSLTSAVTEATELSSDEDLFYALNSADPRINRKKISGTEDFELEHSLKIDFEKVNPGEVALVTKSIKYQNIDISQYKKMTLLYFGDTTSGNRPAPDGLLYNGNLRFVFRFGSNDSTYYEYHNDIRMGWQQAVISLEAITKLKDSYMVRNPGVAIDYTSGNYRVVAKKPGTEPSIANITWMALGVEYHASNETDVLKGSIWINEMKVDGISRLNGWATRASMNTKWADFLDIKAGVNYTDGDFRMMNESGYSARDSKLQTSISSGMNLDRFLPRAWGVSIPLGGSISSDIDRPQLKKNSDIRLDNDGIYNMVVDAIELATDSSYSPPATSSQSELYGKKQFKGRVYTNYGKSTHSDKVIPNLTADRISTDFSYSKNISLENLGTTPEEDATYFIKHTTDDYTGKLKYDLSPSEPPKWTKWRPFENTTMKWTDELPDYEFSLLPSTIKFDLADVTYGQTKHVENKTGIQTNVRRSALQHGFTFNYYPISPLASINYSVNISRDLDSIANAGGFTGVRKNVLKGDQHWKDYYVLMREMTRRQNLSLDFNPRIFSWLSSDFDYSSAYSADMVIRPNDPFRYIHSTVQPKFSFSSSLEIGTLLKRLAEIEFDSVRVNIFARADTVYSKIGLRSINFSYSAATNINNSFLGISDLGGRSGFDFVKYQFGFSGREELADYIRGSMSDRSFGGMRSRQATINADYSRDTRSVERRYSISTGLDLNVPFDISFSPISLEWSNRVGLKASDTLWYDSSKTFPKIQVSANTSALMKIDLIKSNFKSFRCNSSYNFEKSSEWSSRPDYKGTKKISWRPLLSLNGDIAALPITLSYNFNRSMTYDSLGTERDSLMTSTTTDLTKEHDYSIKYEIQKNSRLSEIKFLRWTIPVSGKTTIGMKGSFKKQFATKDDIRSNVTDTTVNVFSFSLSPRVTYVFTSNVDGEMYYQFGQNRDMKDESNPSIRTNNEFAIILNIKL